VRRSRTIVVVTYVAAFTAGVAVTFGLNLWWDSTGWRDALVSALAGVGGAMLALAAVSVWRRRRLTS
jgi:hypothetical protein